jgi:hypothetical protein
MKMNNPVAVAKSPLQPQEGEIPVSPGMLYGPWSLAPFAAGCSLPINVRAAVRFDDSGALRNSSCIVISYCLNG